MAPKVSVISPMYNVENYIEDCLQSLLSQEYANFEAIFVDDGSTDSTVQRAKDLVAEDDRFLFLTQQHSGQSVARNKALEHATGEFVLFLDSDDAYVPQTISRLLSVQQSFDLDAVFFTAKMNYESRELVHSHYEAYMDRVEEPQVRSGFEMMVHFHEEDSFRPSACMYLIRRSVLEDARLRFYEGIIHEDLLFTLQVFPHIKRCTFLLEPLYVRRMRHGSTMTTPRSLKNVEGLFTVAQVIESQLKEHATDWPVDYIDAVCNRIYNTWNDLAKDAIELGEAEMKAYRDTLSPEDRIAFNLHVIEAGNYLAAATKEYSESTSYKLGHALLAGPAWVKDHLQKTPE